MKTKQVISEQALILVIAIFALILIVGLFSSCEKDSATPIIVKNDTTHQDTVLKQPQASFYAENTESITSGVVRFLNNSENYQTCLWDFGNGQTSTETNPVHNYKQAGVYSVKLTVYNDTLQDSCSIENYITITKKELKQIGSMTILDFDFAGKIYDATSMKIGATDSVNGKENSKLMKQFASNPSISAGCACEDLDIYGFNDWYVPAIDELKVIHLNRDSSYTLNRFYISSTEIDGREALLMFFENQVNIQNVGKWQIGFVRCVR